MQVLNDSHKPQRPRVETDSLLGLGSEPGIFMFHLFSPILQLNHFILFIIKKTECYKMHYLTPVRAGEKT
jgi:hypothetical protein